MNILLIDNNQSVISLFEHLNTVEEFNIFFCNNEQEASNVYDKEDIYIVIIDMSLSDSKEILDYIVCKYPKQRIITTGDTLEYSEIKGCEYCNGNYNKKRVLKPIDVHEIVTLIKNFDALKCKYHNMFSSKTGLIDIMEDIVRRFIGTTYNKDEKTIIALNEHTVVQIATFLYDLEIKFDMDQRNCIKLYL